MSGAAILRDFITLVPEVDERALEREGQRAGRRAATTLAGEFAAGIREGMAEGAREGTPDVEKQGEKAGESFGKRFGDGAKAHAGKALSAATGGGIGALFVKGMSDAMQGQQLTAKLTAQLGLTSQQSKTAGEVAGKLFAGGYGDSMEDVNDALKSVMQNMDGMKGASSSTLTDITGKTLTVAKTFDQDLGGTTRAVSQMMRTGLATNATQALDIITAGFQNGADKSEDFLDTLNEYGTQFRKLGIDGATATGLITQGLKAGARDGDLVADTIKEFSIRSIDGSKGTVAAYKELGLNADAMTKKIAAGGPAAKQGLGEVLTKLRQVKDPAQQAAIATSLFGTQAEDMGKALFALDPTKAAKGLGQVAGATDKANKAMNATPQAKLNNFVRSLQGGLVNVLGTKVIPAMERFKTQFEKGEGAGGKFRDVLEDVRSAIETVSRFVSAHPDLTKGLVVGAAGLLATKKSIDGVSSAFRSAKSGADTAKAGWDAGKSALSGIKSAASSTSSAFSQLKAGLSGAKPPNATAWSAAGNSMRNAGTAAKGHATAALASSRAALANAASTARSGAASALAAAKTGIATAATKVMTGAQRALNLVMRANPIGIAVTALIALGAGMVVAYKKSETFRRIVDAVWRGVKTAFKGTIDWITGTAWPAMKGFFDKIGGTISSAKNAVVKAWSGITGAFSGAYNWVTGFFKKNWATVLTVLTGPVGLAVGQIIKHRDKITGAFSAAKTWVVTTFKKAWGGITKVFTDPVGSAKRSLDTLLGATGLRKPFIAVKDWVKGFFKREWNGLKKIFTDPVGAARNLLDTLLGATGLRKPFTAVKDWVKGFFKREWNGLKRIFTDPVDAAKTAISNIFGSDDRHGIRGAFSNMVTSAKRIWDKIKGIVSKPIKGVIDIVNSPFISGFNKVGKIVGLKIDTISTAGLANGGTVPGRAGGGIIPGPWYGPKADNVLGLSDNGIPTARVNPGEFITSYAATSSMEKRHPGALEFINRYGTLPTFAEGGRAPGSGHSWQWQWEQVRARFPSARLTSTVRPGSRTNYGNASYHSMGRAIDIGGSPALMKQVASWLAQNFATSAGDIIHSPLWGHDYVRLGKMRHNIREDTYRQHFDHVHWGLATAAEMGGGKSFWNMLKGAAGGAVGVIFDKLKAPAFKLLDGVAGKFGGGQMASKLLSGYAKKLIEKAISFGNDSSAGADDGSGGSAGTKAAAAWRPEIVKALKLNGITPTEGLIQKWIRQIQSESGGNPNIVQQVRDINWPHNKARGLVQVTPQSFKAYRLPTTSNNIFDPVANLAAGINVAKHSRFGMGQIGNGHGYGLANGGFVKNGLSEAFAAMLGATPNVPVFDTGGTLRPGLNLVDNQTGRPEPLVRRDQINNGGDTIINLEVHGNADAEKIVDELVFELGRLSRRGKYAPTP